MTIHICWKGTPIGEHTDQGKVLDKTAFCALRNVERLRAYLLMVWPAARSSQTISRVCGVRPEDIVNYLKTDVRDGTVVKPARGQWQARPVVAGLAAIEEVPHG